MLRDQEVEFKLEVEPGAAKSLRAHPLLAGRALGSARQRSIYFDTPDEALRRAGYSLRVRLGDGRAVQTVKGRGGAAAGLFDRPEWEELIDGESPDLAALERTPAAALLGKKARMRLAPVLSADVERTRWEVARDGSIVEIVLDEGQVIGGTAAEAVSELELELKKGRAALLLDLARELADAAPLRLGVLTKAERGYRLADGVAGRPNKAEPLALDDGMTTAHGFAAIAQACLRHFRLNEGLIAADGDPAALHQARVAMRRLRSAFSLFGPAIRDGEFERLRAELRWFTGELGEARNLDVLLKRAGDEKLGALRGTLVAARKQAYQAVAEALAAPQLRRLMLDLLAWTVAGEWRREPIADEPLTGFALGRLDQRWRRVKRGGRSLGQLDPEPLHRLRIEVKKLRYAAEFLQSLLSDGKAVAARRKAFLAALEDLQERLGHLNDAATGEELLQRLCGAEEGKLALRRLGFGTGAPEKKQIAAAERAFGRLKVAGPFWRDKLGAGAT